MRRTSLFIQTVVAVLVLVCVSVAPANSSTQGSNSTWIQTAPLQQPRALFDMTRLLDGRVLAVGGTAGTGTLASAETFSANTNSWSAAASLLQARSRHVLVTLNDGRALAVGGRVRGVSLASAELYLPSLNRWQNTASLAVARDNHAVALLTDGRVLVTGGVSATGRAEQPEVTRTAEIYDPTTSTWQAAASMRQARYSHSASLLPDGRVLVVGGFVPGPFHVATRSAEIYDPLLNEWHMLAPMPTARAVHAAAVLKDGSVLVAGGVINPPNELHATDASELYHPYSGTWHATGALMVARRSLSGAAVLSNGTVLLSGGADNNNNRLGSAELFNPSAGAWSPTGSMHSARVGFAVEPLTEDQVLVAGGIGGAGAALSSAEIYSR